MSQAVSFGQLSAQVPFTARSNKLVITVFSSDARIDSLFNVCLSAALRVNI